MNLANREFDFDDVPSNWLLRERGGSDFAVSDLCVPARYLHLEKDGPRFLGITSKEYFFSSRGLVNASRALDLGNGQNRPVARINLSDDFLTTFEVFHKEERGDAIADSIKVEVHKPPYLDLEGQGFTHANEVPYHGARLPIANIKYSLGTLLKIELGNGFFELGGFCVRSPEVGLLHAALTDPNDTESYYLDLMQLKPPFKMTKKPTNHDRDNTVFSDVSNGQSPVDVFRLDWEIEDGIFILRQRHLPTGVFKVIKAPCQYDPKQLGQTAFSFIGRDGSGDVVDSWREIGKKLGVRVGYTGSAESFKKMLEFTKSGPGVNL